MFTFAGNSGQAQGPGSSERVHKLKPSNSTSNSARILSSAMQPVAFMKNAWSTGMQELQREQQRTQREQQRAQELKAVLSKVGLLHFFDR